MQRSHGFNQIIISIEHKAQVRKFLAVCAGNAEYDQGPRLFWRGLGRSHRCLQVWIASERKGKCIPKFSLRQFARSVWQDRSNYKKKSFKMRIYWSIPLVNSTNSKWFDLGMESKWLNMMYDRLHINNNLRLGDSGCVRVSNGGHSLSLHERWWKALIVVIVWPTACSCSVLALMLRSTKLAMSVMVARVGWKAGACGGSSAPTCSPRAGWVM